MEIIQSKTKRVLRILITLLIILILTLLTNNSLAASVSVKASNGYTKIQFIQNGNTIVKNVKNTKNRRRKYRNSFIKLYKKNNGK